MTSPDNILLHLAPQQEAQVRGIFDRLEARGFPKQNQTPHITITFAATMPQAAVDVAAELLPPLIPATFSRVGTVIFGTRRKQTIAWLLETTDELEIAARKISAANPDGRGPRWTPHLTMGLRIPRTMIGDYLHALDEETSPHFRELTAETAGLWVPRTQDWTPLAGENLKSR